MLELKPARGSRGPTYRGNDAQVALGRAIEAQVSFHDHPNEVVSEQHALVEFQGDWYVVLDRGSRNGTFVNGQRVTTPVPLRDGDIIQLGADTGPELEVSFVYNRAQWEAWQANQGRGTSALIPLVIVATLVLMVLALGVAILVMP